jgi:hypothetical protein
MREYSWQEDAELSRFIADAVADIDTVGLILSGSRGAGFAADDSDYDLYWVLTDAVYDRREQRGEPLKIRLPATERRTMVEVMYACPGRLAETAATPGWWTAGYADARVLLDKTGQVAEALAAIRVRPAEPARADVAAWFDAYLNAFYRSMKAWRRGDELGGRLQAAESAIALIRTLFALERRWPPYHDRLARQLDSLSDQGWPPASCGRRSSTCCGRARRRRNESLRRGSRRCCAIVVSAMSSTPGTVRSTASSPRADDRWRHPPKSACGAFGRA